MYRLFGLQCRSFGLQNINPQIIKQSGRIEQRFTKEYLQQFVQNPNFEKEREDQKVYVKQMEIENRIQNSIGNDSMQQNYIRVKIEQEVEVEERVKIQRVMESDDYVRCIDELKDGYGEYNPRIFMKPPKVELQQSMALRGRCKTSVKKLVLSLHSCKKKYCLDALGLLESNEDKASMYIKRCMISAIENGKNKGLDPERLWVQSIMVGKQTRFKKLRYHAKSRHGMIKKDVCWIKVVLIEKPVQALYEAMITTKTRPYMFSARFRSYLINQQSGLDLIHSNQMLLHSKGKQQFRLMIKRRVQMLQRMFNTKGVRVNRQLIERKVIGGWITTMANHYNESQSQYRGVSLQQRQKVYQMNQTRM